MNECNSPNESKYAQIIEAAVAECDIKMVIPGKTKLPPKLPPNVKPPGKLQEEKEEEI